MNDLEPFVVTQTPNPAGAGIPCRVAPVKKYTLLPIAGAGSSLTTFSFSSGVRNVYVSHVNAVSAQPRVAKRKAKLSRGQREISKSTVVCADSESIGRKGNSNGEH
jgi:hypothetical protein